MNCLKSTLINLCRDAVDGVKREDTPVAGGDTTTHTNNAQNQEQSGDMAYEAPSELPAQAYARALYPFKGKSLILST